VSDDGARTVHYSIGAVANLRAPSLGAEFFRRNRVIFAMKQKPA